MITTVEASAAALPRAAKGLVAALIAAGAVTVGLGFAMDGRRVWTDLLVNSFYFLALALAGAFFVAIHYLARSGWWVAIRRVPEAMMGFIPIAGLLMLTVFFGRRLLYPWSRPELLAHDPLLAAKSQYLNVPFFFARMVLFLGLWSLCALLLRRASLGEDRDGSRASHRSLVRRSAFFIVTFAFSFALASFDWLMSLDAHWFSTIFAVYIFAGLFVQGMAAITLAVVLLRERGPLAHAVNESHLHDLGKLLFAFSIFWAYIWVAQYLLIWYANIPEEATYYTQRTSGGWLFWFALVFVLNWIVPFLVLMPRAAKRNGTVLKIVAVALLVGHWLDLYVVVAPPVLSKIHLGLPEILITAGYAALFFFVAARSLARAPILPRNDPFLAESLHHHQ